MLTLPIYVKIVISCWIIKLFNGTEFGIRSLPELSLLLLHHPWTHRFSNGFTNKTVTP